VSEKRQGMSRRQSERNVEHRAMPAGAVMADPSKQVPNNSYGAPLLFHVDQPFTCIDCGKSEIWTAHQQKWYYEVAKGSGYPTAVRCRDCRKVHAQIHSGKGDPDPIKHEGTLIKYVQSAIAPAIAEAGFVFVCKTKLPVRGSVALDYSRDDLALTCWYDRPIATLIAETMDTSANCSEVARVALNASRRGSRIVDRIAEFSAVITQYLSSLCPSEPER